MAQLVKDHTCTLKYRRKLLSPVDVLVVDHDEAWRLPSSGLVVHPAVVEQSKRVTNEFRERHPEMLDHGLPGMNNVVTCDGVPVFM